VVIYIENPRVPGSIPGRGTITQKPRTEMFGVFLFQLKKNERAYPCR